MVEVTLNTIKNLDLEINNLVILKLAEEIDNGNRTKLLIYKRERDEVIVRCIEDSSGLKAKSLHFYRNEKPFIIFPRERNVFRY
jgi:hypothetical protein